MFAAALLDIPFRDIPTMRPSRHVAVYDMAEQRGYATPVKFLISCFILNVLPSKPYARETHREETVQSTR